MFVKFSMNKNLRILFQWCTGLVALNHMRPSPAPGIEPVPPALQGSFLATGPPGKPLGFVLFWFWSV